MEKENSTDASDSSENEIPGLNSLKPFEFERKTNIGDINSNQKQQPQEFYKKTVFKNFVILKGKHLCWSLFLIKLQASRPPTQLLSCKHCKIFKIAYFEENLRAAASE